jgi:PAS domain S-box-containing protein
MADSALPPRANILLVDDQPANLLALEAVLSELGETLVRAASGDQALRLLGEQDFAVVLLDVRMPGLSGFETAQRMRAADRTKHTPVIFLSAAESAEFPVAEAYRLGAIDYLVKPLIPDILRAKVAVFVDLFRKGERLRQLERRERARAEEALRETERRFARFMEHLPGLAWIKDLAGRYIFANDSAERAFGILRTDLYGKTDDEVFPRETAARFRENDHRAAKTPAGLQVVETLTHPDGTLHHSLVSKFPIPGPDGRPAMVGGVAIDVTELKRTEEELRAAEERSEFVRRVSGIGFWYCDLPFEVLQWDERVKAHFWLPPDSQVTINTFYARLHPDSREPTRAAIERSIAERTGYDVHYRTVDPATGAEKRVRAIGRTFYAPDGTPVRFDGVTLDVTEQKRIEAALAETSRRKDEFMAMLAHELRNPLAPLRNALQILSVRGTDPAALERVRAIMDRQVTHLGRLVDDLLDVSRLTIGKVQLRRERLDLVVVALQTAADHRASFEAKSVALGITVPDVPVPVHGDPIRLAQLFDNLLTNALKFTPQGGQVSVSVSGGDEWAVLIVRDTGAGIEPEMLARLFEPFSQADRTLDRSSGGLGLGLVVVKGLAELHGGSVHADSPGLNKGSTFTVNLPTYFGPPALAPQPVSPRRAAKCLRVLVVEDNKDSADSLRILLEAYGYQVEVAYSGPDGIRAAESYRPDVIICDIGLPGMDGYRVAESLRGNPMTSTARLIALTGYGQEEDRRRAKEAGFDEYLIKPADPVALEAAIAAAR